MFSKFIAEGDKIELQAVSHGGAEPAGTAGKVYHSKVHEIQSEDTIEITMPVEKTKLILLPVDSEFEMIFYASGGLFQCLGRIIDRYKSNNMYLLLVEMTSNLRKYQRREFYRLRCALEMRARTLEEEEIQTIENRQPFALQKGLPLKESIIVDISGGGLRFLSSCRYEPGSLMYCCYHLMNGGEHKKYEVISRVISSIELDNRPGTYEHRVQFYDMDPIVREEIIKYIFEEERKSRQKTKFSTEKI
ncbi:flagellar brake protein [Acetatifactor muris]|uniref:Flagellar brake protein YcgR n=1 Tax=Acetatifactor muris TaxID=879566 RepID=A0A2K4ZIM1_9FIRM|nr:flagellar brake protein [Acetatifactor muris]MCR2048630.1 flagellar brake protein [Acetatifactor muris]SOY30310.1 Flagellar brake protein YcgR [Acetatifactor muris]